MSTHDYIEVLRRRWCRNCNTFQRWDGRRWFDDGSLLGRWPGYDKTEHPCPGVKSGFANDFATEARENNGL